MTLRFKYDPEHYNVPHRNGKTINEGVTIKFRYVPSVTSVTHTFNRSGLQSSYTKRTHKTLAIFVSGPMHYGSNASPEGEKRTRASFRIESHHYSDLLDRFKYKGCYFNIRHSYKRADADQLYKQLTMQYFRKSSAPLMPAVSIKFHKYL